MDILFSTVNSRSYSTRTCDRRWDKAVMPGPVFNQKCEDFENQGFNLLSRVGVGPWISVKQFRRNTFFPSSSCFWSCPSTIFSSKRLTSVGLNFDKLFAKVPDPSLQQGEHSKRCIEVSALDTTCVSYNTKTRPSRLRLA